MQLMLLAYILWMQESLQNSKEVHAQLHGLAALYSSSTPCRAAIALVIIYEY